MAVGDDATSVGYPLVPDTGEDGKVKWGAREINRTRDFTALIQKILNNKVTVRQKAGISSGSAEPSGGNDGDIYFRVI